LCCAVLCCVVGWGGVGWREIAWDVGHGVWCVGADDDGSGLVGGEADGLAFCLAWPCLAWPSASHKHKHTHTHTHTNTRAHIRTQTHAHSHSHTKYLHPRIHTHIHTHTHIHIHTHSLSLSLSYATLLGPQSRANSSIPQDRVSPWIGLYLKLAPTRLKSLKVHLASPAQGASLRIVSVFDVFTIRAPITATAAP